MPTRVLDVAPDGDDSRLRLFVTNGVAAPFTSLSYCWGAPQPQMLVTTNFDAYQQRIDIRTLPNTIQDAIHLVRSIGLRYIWIDSLCILQDSAEDKAHEIGQMAQIYRDAYFTLQISAAQTCNDGFLDRPGLSSDPPDAVFPYFVEGANSEVGSMTLRTANFSNEYHPTEEPANKRAWIFQERTLSLRLLNVPSSPHPFQWHCMTAIETDGGLPIDPQEGGMEKLGSGLQTEDPTKLQSLWRRMVHNFMSRSLTVGTDKLPAIAGVASEFARFRPSKYYAGLWGDYMTRDLLWRVLPPNIVDMVDDGTKQPYRAPTWSWASTDVEVLLTNLTDFYPDNFEILSCSTEPKYAGVDFGEIKSASLVVKALLKRARWDKHPARVTDGDVHVGDGHSDRPQDRGEIDVWCMAILDASKYAEKIRRSGGLGTGLLLEPVGDKFRRLGSFNQRKFDWFDGCESRIVEII